jgi:hypothetical protein
MLTNELDRDFGLRDWSHRLVDSFEVVDLPPTAKLWI